MQQWLSYDIFNIFAFNLSLSQLVIKVFCNGSHSFNSCFIRYMNNGDCKKFSCDLVTSITDTNVAKILTQSLIEILTSLVWQANFCTTWPQLREPKYPHTLIPFNNDEMENNGEEGDWWRFWRQRCSSLSNQYTSCPPN